MVAAEVERRLEMRGMATGSTDRCSFGRCYTADANADCPIVSFLHLSLELDCRDGIAGRGFRVLCSACVSASGRALVAASDSSVLSSQISNHLPTLNGLYLPFVTNVNDRSAADPVAAVDVAVAASTSLAAAATVAFHLSSTIYLQLAPAMKKRL